MKPWSRLLKHVSGKQRLGAHASKNAKKPRKPRRLAAEPSRTHLGTTEALEKHAKEVTMSGGVFGDHGGRFFKTLLDRQEERQKHLNELPAQLCQTRSSQ